jgi:hypothetical protein
MLTVQTATEVPKQGACAPCQPTIPDSRFADRDVSISMRIESVRE